MQLVRSDLEDVVHEELCEDFFQAPLSIHFLVSKDVLYQLFKLFDLFVGVWPVLID